MKRIILATIVLLGLAAWAQAPEGSVRGRILDLENNPIEGAKLVFTHEIEKSFREEVETSKNGSFSVRRIPSGPMTITATKEGHDDRKWEYTQEPGNVRLLYRMVPQGTTYASLGPQPNVSGTLVDTSGKGIPDADVRLSSVDLPDYEQILKTNGQGYFEAPGLANALVLVHARKEGYRDQLYQFDMQDKDYQVKDYRMQTLEEYFEEIGEAPPEKKVSPEDLAIDFYNQAVEPFQNKDYDQAELFVAKALENNAELEPAIKMMVYINHGQQEWENSLSWAEKYLAMKPDDTGILQFAEEAARLSDNTAASEKYLLKLKDAGIVKEKTIEDYVNDAVRAINAMDDETAKGILEKVLAKDANFPEAHMNMGMIYLREFEFEPPLRHLKLFLKHAPNNHPKRKEVTDLIVTLSE
jgi:tetratricopeptide (TPR) repeat protein